MGSCPVELATTVTPIWSFWPVLECSSQLMTQSLAIVHIELDLLVWLLIFSSHFTFQSHQYETCSNTTYDLDSNSSTSSYFPSKSDLAGRLNCQRNHGYLHIISDLCEPDVHCDTNSCLMSSHWSILWQVSGSLCSVFKSPLTISPVC